MKPTIEEQAEAYAISRMGELVPSWDDDKKLWHRRNIESCRDYYVADFKAAQGVICKIIEDEILNIKVPHLEDPSALLPNLLEKLK